MKNPMLDKEFLKQLMEHRNRTIHARITALTMAELPVETIEGSVTGGSISIDGTSAVRRTCNLSLVGKKSVITDIHWAIRNKFKLEIGVENTINQEYDDIIWFKQGIYGITNFSYSENSNSCTISIQGKDKMAYLDGTFGGNITAQTDFGKWDEIDAEGNVTTYDQLIYNIIRNILHEFAGEPYQNIVIEDLDQFGYELWEYRGDKEYPMYYFYDIGESKFVNATINGDMKIVIVENDEDIETDLKSLTEDQLYQYAIHETGQAVYLPIDSTKKTPFYISKIEYGEVAGYHKTGLIFAGELVGNPGETVVTILDKIKNMLGAFEYFYDLDGRFRFKKQDNYIYGSLSPLSGEAKDTLAATANQKISYSFEGNSMVSSISNSPGIAELKNDFVVWGVKKSAAGGEIPIHARYAVCHKPQSYKTFDNYIRVYPTYIKAVQYTEEKASKEQLYVKRDNNYYPVRWRGEGEDYYLLYEYMLYNGDANLYEKKNNVYTLLTDTSGYYCKTEVGFVSDSLEGDLNKGEYYRLVDRSRIAEASEYDWRELLYLMARDYYQHHEFPDYTLELISRGYFDGKTGYEPFYADMQAFWRQLYNPNPQTEYIKTSQSLAQLVNMAKKDATNGIPLEDQYNGYRLEIKENSGSSIDDDSYGYLVPLEIGNNDGVAEYYLLNQSVPTDKELIFNEDSKLLNNNVIKILKDEAVNTVDPANPDCYNHLPTFYKAIDNYYPMSHENWPGWSKDAVLSPESLIFWIDFLDTAGSIGEYSMQNIGHRPKVEPSDQMIKTIYNRATPSVEFVVYPDKIDSDDQVGQTLQLSPLQINQTMEAAFTISSQGLAAADKIDELVYKHLCQAEGISMTTIPVYYLEPNTVIYAESDNVNVQGNYLVTQMNIPLTYNGTMSITAHKLVKYLK